MRGLLALHFLFALPGLPGMAVAIAAAPAEGTLSAEQAVAAALARSPALAEAEAAVQRALGTRGAECGLRHDPTVSVSADVRGAAWSVSASQPLSLAGEGRAACAQAGHALDASRGRRDRARFEVAAATRHTWVDAVAAASRQDLAARGLEVARRIEGATGQRARVGEASGLELRLALLQVEQARTAWMAAAVEAVQLLAALSAATGVDLDRLTLPGDPLEGAPVPAGGSGPVGQGQGALRSDVVAARADVEAARAAVAGARAGTLPPVSVGAFVEEEGPERRVGPELTWTLPLWRGNVEGRARAGADLTATGTAGEAVARQASAEQAAAARTGAVLATALDDQPADVPGQAQAALESLELGFDQGELDLLSVSLMQAEIIDGHAAWLEGRRVVAGARIDAMLAEEDPALLGGVAP